jgi:DNA polymerase (family 10)/putative hydrolase
VLTLKRFWQAEERLLPGDWHIHTSYTDGADTVDTYCQRAVSHGLKLLAFTEHVRKELDYSYPDLLADIARTRKEFNLKLLAGCEAKVLDTDGSLDVAEEVIKQCDIVTAVFHSFTKTDKESYLQALKAMLKNPYVHIWGHPTLFTRLNHIYLDEAEMNSIIELCIENQVLIERNLKHRLPDEDFIKLAINRGAQFVIGSDAHSASELPTPATLSRERQYIANLRQEMPVM